MDTEPRDTEATASPSDAADPDPKRKWRKKRKTFLSNAKKYARKGQLGRGARMPEETYQYFVGILEVMQKGVDTEEEKQSLVNNVLERTKGDEINIVGNQLGCRVVELLLPYASPEDLERYMEALTPELRRLCSDNFSSHVIEKLLSVSCDRATESLQNSNESALEDGEDETPKKKIKLEIASSKYSPEHVEKCNQFTIKLCKYALNNLEDFVFDLTANYILRSAIKCLSGITLLPGEKLKKNIFKDAADHETVHKSIPPHQTKITYKAVPDEYKEILKEYASRLSAWPQFKDLPYKNTTSALLQVLLFAVKNVDNNLTKSILKKLLNESFAPEDWAARGEDWKEDKKIGEDDKKDVDLESEKPRDDVVTPMKLPPVFESEGAVRLLEAALFVANKKMYTQIYAKCFINRLGQLVTMPRLNFTVQRLFDNCQIKEEMEPMFDELADKFPSILASGNTGVLVAVGKACLRLKARQAQFLSSLEVGLNASANPKYLAVLCLRLLPSFRVDFTKLHEKYLIHIHGSVLVQTVLQFQRPTKMVSSLLELSTEELLVVLEDAKGCHVADTFFQGEFVGVKSRDKMVWKLKGTYQKLAMSQYGSRAFEVIFAACSPEQKVKIMSELADKGQILNSTLYGRLVGSKLNVDLFRASQDKWKDSLNKKGKAEDILKDIVGGN